MIIDSRGKHSITAATAETLDNLGMEGTVSIEWLIMPNGEKKSPDYIRSFIRSMTKGNTAFKTRMLRGDLVIWRLRETELSNRPTPGSKSKWPLAGMALGEKITVEIGQYGKADPQIYPHNYGKKYGKKFTTRRNGNTYHITRIR
jgi:hypothetical protein